MFQAFYELLVSGKIGDLFSKEEMDAISSQIAEKHALEEDNVVQSTTLSQRNLHKMFVEVYSHNIVYEIK